MMSSNGKPFSFDKSEINPGRGKASVKHTVLDVVMFLLTSLGYILQAIFFALFGKPKKDLHGELVLVTGGGGGLGRMLALRLTKLGAKVIVWDINQDGIDETVKIIQSMGGFCKGYKVDISNKEQVYKSANMIREDVGDVSILFNNAGVVSGRALLDTPDHLIERSFSVNILAHFWTTKAFLPSMLERDHGHIVTIASLAGHVGISKLVDYCSSKFAAVGFDEALRIELEYMGAHGIFTTVICPYFIQSTGMFDDVNSRWVPTLNSNEVADQIIDAVRKNEKYAIIPGYLRLMLAVKWFFPWGCNSGFLRRLVPDATPQHALTPVLTPNGTKMNGSAHPLSSSEATDNNNTKASPLLVHRLSTGERVL
ncbi:short-chain dehydrogenase/reductase family 16C member 6 isoform X1 [Toxorhynchites rutilus septentrionalis]|uniref:short-chain dehydrogenase/reductase family 16C member 6 isoform X1 n=1 Tax=Toxorhynchites rutilus septentrionalis TaxID=329112 RepID=UPI002478B536|nr:short-chain dehydrogenase/reductase family 16C member 6 isoform X1 [Toxorhynchites rutilus septentrionalis]XP_055636901.1 short-chain dehydrogenase/reductase family 16C member 6 isoform X1 [Toxorhynchites rutilus septentrionalis]XP_055636902.1 short-chain dehydrogenase/reductase family 16C member 6 isoform X1 [Toxorhynchites rutilus septentrionalis]XP_055636903.1 short-chain dehydrogenase/reductase family 16C member 6 isoform X1 [Toxorhynchites rutilus septentrionalis]XP_055636904.1 short-ch